MQCGARPKLKGEQMKLFFNILNYTIFGVLLSFSVFMALQPDTLMLGVILGGCFLAMATAFWSIINKTEAERAEMRAKRRQKVDAGGVHAFWWVFWLIAFFPALIVVAIIHNGRKTRAAIREVKQGE